MPAVSAPVKQRRGVAGSFFSIDELLLDGLLLDGLLDRLLESVGFSMGRSLRYNARQLNVKAGSFL